jgi:glucose-1-phosphate thymidylyltransferase
MSTSNTRCSQAPTDLAQAFIIGDDFVANGQPSALVLGDNIFYGHDFASSNLPRCQFTKQAAPRVFAYHVHDPERYGVVAFDQRHAVPAALKKNPSIPRVTYAVTGLYFYDEPGRAILPSSIQPSPTGVNLRLLMSIRPYLDLQGQLSVRDHAAAAMPGWTRARMTACLKLPVSLPHCKSRQGSARSPARKRLPLRQKWIDAAQIQKLAAPLAKNGYGQYLLSLLK